MFVGGSELSEFMENIKDFARNERRQLLKSGLFEKGRISITANKEYLVMHYYFINREKSYGCKETVPLRGIALQEYRLSDISSLIIKTCNILAERVKDD